MRHWWCSFCNGSPRFLAGHNSVRLEFRRHVHVLMGDVDTLSHLDYLGTSVLSMMSWAHQG